MADNDVCRRYATTADPSPGRCERSAALVVSRPIRPDDGPALRRHFDRLSPETRYLRFFSPMTKLDDRLLAFLVHVDHGDRDALVALVRDGTGGSGGTAGDEIIAVARYDRCAGDPAAAEIAVVVEDAWQHEGVGRYLMRRLGEVALERGITRFIADVLPDNLAPVRLARAVAPMVETSFVDGRTHLVIPLTEIRPDIRSTGSAALASRSLRPA